MWVLQHRLQCTSIFLVLHNWKLPLVFCKTGLILFIDSTLQFVRMKLICLKHNSKHNSKLWRSSQRRNVIPTLVNISWKIQIGTWAMEKNIARTAQMFEVDWKQVRTWSDFNWTRTQNHLVLKWTLNHLAKLA